VCLRVDANMVVHYSREAKRTLEDDDDYFDEKEKVC